MPLTVSDGGGRGANGAGFGIILKLYIYILKKDIFLHLFLALCALKALNKLILFFSSTKLEDFFFFHFFKCSYQSSCLVACLSNLSLPRDEVPFLLSLPDPQLRGAQRYKVPKFVS